MVSADRQLLTFRIGGESYALSVSHVRRVAPRQELTPVPGAPPQLPGVFVSQGQLIAALDPRIVLALPPPSAEEQQFLVIATDGDLVAGLLVDWVEDVVSVAAGDIEPASGQGAEYSMGQVRLQGTLVSLLNLSALFSAVTGG